jgi:GNAT superfamily N-acetyltransferase
MPTITLQLASPIRRTFRAMQVAGMFDVPIEERLEHKITAEVPGLDEPWSIGAIVGPSGSGKTTLAKAAFPNCVHEPQPWPNDAPIIDCLDQQKPIKEITRVLTAVGLGSVPTWLKPYRILSTGERFRADLARALIDTGINLTQRRKGAEESNKNFLCASAPLRETSPLVFDEFTSSLDRTIARTTSAALARFVRSAEVPPGRRDLQKLRFVAVTCHDDILDWLQPDWVLRLKNNEGPQLTRGPLQRPTIKLAVQKVPQSTWTHFARHHYLAGGLARSATCYAAFWNDETNRRVDAAVNRPAHGPIAFCAAVAALGWKKTKRITRLVTLPEFQGLGIASQLLQIVAAHEASKDNRVTITASHPAILAHCSQSPHWQLTGHKPTGSTTQTYRGRRIGCSLGRAVASFQFMPDVAKPSDATKSRSPLPLGEGQGEGLSHSDMLAAQLERRPHASQFANSMQINSLHPRPSPTVMKKPPT